MGTLNSWDVTDANNNLAPPDGWPENTMNYSDVNNTGRAVQGTMKRFFADINGSLDAGGAADAYTLTLNESGYTAYFDGMMFSCSIPATNTLTNPTIDVNGIGAQTIVDRLGNALGVGELMSGGIYEFRYDGTNFRLVGSGNVGGIAGQVQFNNGGAFGGATGLLYNSGTAQATAVNPFNVLTDVVFTEQSDHTSTPGASFGYLWLRDDNPTSLVFTDSDGIDVTLGTTGSTPPAGVDGALQYNNAGNLGGMDEWVYDDSAISKLAFTSAVQRTSVSQIAFEMTVADITSSYAMQIEINADDNLAAGGALNLRGLGTNASGGGTFAGILQVLTNNTSSAARLIANPDARALHCVGGVSTRNVELVFLEVDAGSNAEALRIQQDGDQQHIVLTGTQGTGIQFANGDLSTDVNTLDVYEEGTWDPRLRDVSDSDAEGQTYAASNQGKYTKIGNMVMIEGSLTMTNIGTLSGALFIANLPFTKNGMIGDSGAAVAIGNAVNMSITASESLSGNIGATASRIALRLFDEAGGNSGLIDSEVTNSFSCTFSGVYLTDE